MIKTAIRFNNSAQEFADCTNLDTCPTVRMILDKDLTDFQYQDIIRRICGGCSEFERRPPTGMTVIVFDRRGRQIPSYQGPYETVKDSILNDAPPDTIFAHGFTVAGELRRVSREEW